MVVALNESAGIAQQTYRLLCPVLRQLDKQERYQLTTRLKEALGNKEPMSDLDWGLRARR
jgi:cell division inhibitor SulA